MANKQAIGQAFAALKLAGLKPPWNGREEALSAVDLYHGVLHDVDDAELSALVRVYLRDDVSFWPSPGKLLSYRERKPSALMLASGSAEGCELGDLPRLLAGVPASEVVDSVRRGLRRDLGAEEIAQIETITGRAHGLQLVNGGGER